MKLKLLLATSLFCASIAYGQQSGQNYVLSRTMLNSEGTDYVDNVQYYDGLGRPMQSLSKAVQASTVKERLATLQEYDNMGRVGNSWLPTPVTANYTEAASLKNLATAASGYSDTHPYGKNVYEASPLERLTSQYGAGAAWHNNSRAVNTAYLLNQASGNLSCKRYYISNNTLAGGGSSDVYAAGRLHVTQTTDEDGKVSYTFTDLLGNTVLVRQVNGSELLDTYYVYDSYNNLRYVLQPMYQSEGNLAKYAFQYEYDYRNRCVKKTLPGADYISYVYDDADLLIYSQDGNQRAVSTTASAQKWTYYKYDGMRRLTEQGECTGQSNTTNAVVHIKNYYDSYSFIGSTGFTSSNYTAGNSYGKGYLTGSEVMVLGSSSKIYKAFYYDQKGREVKRVQNNLLSGYDVTSTTYSFSDKLQTVTHTHTASGKTSRTETATYNYDYADRLSSITHKLGTGTAVTLVSYTYDTKGRLSSQKLHGSLAQSYTYNIRNWLTNTTSSKFTQNLTYNNGTSGYFNGNIQAMSWTANGASHSYSFTYDAANRMLNATHGNNYFTEKVTGYDKNGNITSLQRYGQTGASAYGLLDNLTYTLNGNQLAKVEDATTATSYSGGTNFVNGSTATTEYTYDANGNLTKDLNKNITNISYNCLNLPQIITFSDGSTITYTYAADGTKLRVVHVISGTTTQTDYCGNVIYESGAQKYLLNEVGYYNLSSSGYFYYLKDHQGNNRVVINSSGTVQETNHYYPFGGLFASTSVQPFKYNGKEFDSKKGLNWYDYGARHYDAALGRFTTVDPLGEVTNFSSLYTYCHDSPVNLVDPTGCLASTHTDSIGNVVAVYNDGDLGVYRHKANAEKTRKILADEYSATNTSAGGERMGETLEWNSFVDAESGNPAGGILFGSYLARDEISRSVNFIQSFTVGNNEVTKLLLYAFNARNGGVFDIKYGRVYMGSQISEGKYVSMRDAGNFLAGRVANLNGLPAKMTYTLFGAFNLAKNDIYSIIWKIPKSIELGVSGSYGELPISHAFQRRGFNYNLK